MKTPPIPMPDNIPDQEMLMKMVNQLFKSDCDLDLADLMISSSKGLQDAERRHLFVTMTMAVYYGIRLKEAGLTDSIFHPFTTLNALRNKFGGDLEQNTLQELEALPQRPPEGLTKEGYNRVAQEVVRILKLDQPIPLEQMPNYKDRPLPAPSGMTHREAVGAVEKYTHDRHAAEEIVKYTLLADSNPHLALIMAIPAYDNGWLKRDVLESYEFCCLLCKIGHWKHGRRGDEVGNAIKDRLGKHINSEKALKN